MRIVFIKVPVYKHEDREHLINIKHIKFVTDCSDCTIITLTGGHQLWSSASVEFINTFIELEQNAALGDIQNDI